MRAAATRRDQQPGVQHALSYSAGNETEGLEPPTFGTKLRRSATELRLNIARLSGLSRLVRATGGRCRDNEYPLSVRAFPGVADILIRPLGSVRAGE